MVLRFPQQAPEFSLPSLTLCGPAFGYVVDPLEELQTVTFMHNFAFFLPDFIGKALPRSISVSMPSFTVALQFHVWYLVGAQ